MRTADKVRATGCYSVLAFKGYNDDQKSKFNLQGLHFETCFELKIIKKTFVKAQAKDFWLSFFMKISVTIEENSTDLNST